MNIGIDHGYYAIKTRHCSFPAVLQPTAVTNLTPARDSLSPAGVFFGAE